MNENNAKELICADCQQRFYFTEKDQAFFKKMGFSDPKRCFPCRKKRKADKDRNGFNR